MHKQWIKTAAVATALAVGLTGCDDTTEGPTMDTSNVQVLLTDATSDYVGAARVDIGAVELIPSDDTTDAVVLTDDGTAGLVDLLDLQGEATAQLADAMIDAGTYSQLRLMVDSATVELASGYEFADGSSSKTLFVPSGAQTGIKLNLAEGDAVSEGGLVFEGGDTQVLVLDFDVHQSFVIQGSPDTPAGIQDMLFTPAIRVVVSDVAGSIAGTVSLTSGAPDSISVDGITVTAEPTDDGLLEAYQTETATAVTDSTGSYTIHYLVPGTYTVDIPDSSYVSTPDSVEVTVDRDQDLTGVDLQVESLVSGG